MFLCLYIDVIKYYKSLFIYILYMTRELSAITVRMLPSRGDGVSLHLKTLRLVTFQAKL